MEKRLRKVQSRFYPGDLMTRTGDREIRSVSGRLPDNPGELASMGLSGDTNLLDCSAILKNIS